MFRAVFGEFGMVKRSLSNHVSGLKGTEDPQLRTVKLIDLEVRFFVFDRIVISTSSGSIGLLASDKLD